MISTDSLNEVFLKYDTDIFVIVVNTSWTLTDTVVSIPSSSRDS